MKTSEIQIRDPFIVPIASEHTYYLFGTTDTDAWEGRGQGFNCFKSKDLENWEGPFAAFRPPAGFWGTKNFWAPEVHVYQGRYYMFASFKAPQKYRGTQILVAEKPVGPYTLLTDSPVTPPDWECLDGTLYIDEKGKPWIVFCHEWVQVHNGAMYAMQLSDDLRRRAGRPVFLFNASEAPWVVHPTQWPAPASGDRFLCYVTDGPFLFRTRSNVLLMLWSSSGYKGYAMGFARSESGTIVGPWNQIEQPLWDADGGHGMIFKSFDNKLFLTFHSPNDSPNERPVFKEIEDRGDSVHLKG
jgi:arabinan endo-1,5-alpha-L-arabinosidase